MMTCRRHNGRGTCQPQESNEAATELHGDEERFSRLKPLAFVCDVERLGKRHYPFLTAIKIDAFPIT